MKRKAQKFDRTFEKAAEPKFISCYQSTAPSILIPNGSIDINQEQEYTSPLSTVSYILYHMIAWSDMAWPYLYFIYVGNTLTKMTFMGA